MPQHDADKSQTAKKSPMMWFYICNVMAFVSGALMMWTWSAWVIQSSGVCK